MNRDVPGLRPAIIQPETYKYLEDFLDFRHKVRNLYGFELDWKKLRPALALAESVSPLVVADLETFWLWLDALAADA